MVKKAMKRKRSAEGVSAQVEECPVLPPAKRFSDDPAPRKIKWVNRQRVLVFATRGINHRDRHLMDDIKKLMPHHRPESKMERSQNLQVVNEICETKNCNKAILFEGRLKRDLYMWVSNVPTGPCAKFFVENIYTMGELKMTGNCLRGSRPLLSFDENFNSKPCYKMLKELLIQTFGVPNHHPKSQPFFDHVYTFSILDNKIWFRNFQILTEEGELAEIGPRFVLNPVKIFAGSFGGETLWDNPHYVSPAKYRQSIAKTLGGKYINRLEQKVTAKLNKPEVSYEMNPTDEIFRGDYLEKAAELAEEENEENDEKEETEVKKDIQKKKVGLKGKNNEQKSKKKGVQKGKIEKRSEKGNVKKTFNVKKREGKIKKSKVVKNKKM